MVRGELRIGNFIDAFRIGGEWYPKEIESGREIDFILQQSDKYIYVPIMITKEWLLKLGFEKQDDKYEGYFIKIPSLESPLDLKNGIYVEFDYEEWRVFYEFYSESSMLRTIEYVHQLQNLYFALTGTELKEV